MSKKITINQQLFKAVSITCLTESTYAGAGARGDSEAGLAHYAQSLSGVQAPAEDVCHG